MKELLKQQISWREDLQGSGVYVGVPSFQPPRGLTVVSSSSSSRMLTVIQQEVQVTERGQQQWQDWSSY